MALLERNHIEGYEASQSGKRRQMALLEQISCFLAESNRIEGLESDPWEYFKDIFARQHVTNACDAWRAMTNTYGNEIDITLAQVKLTTNKVKTLHMMTMWNLLPKNQQGVYRTVPVYVGSSTAPPASKIRPLMTAFIKRFAEGKTDPLTMHYEFEKIHPFPDGNSRVGRLLWAWDLLRRGKQVHPILDNFDGDNFQERRQAYYSALQA